MALVVIPEPFKSLMEVSRTQVEKAVMDAAGGGAGTALFGGFLDSVYNSNPTYWEGMFPFMNSPVFPEILPKVNEWIVAGVPAAAALIGALMGNKDIVMAGLGGTIYGGGNLIQKTLTKTLTPHMPPVTAPETPLSQGSSSRYSVKPQATGSRRYRVIG